MKTVYVVSSELNGYQNLMEVFDTKENARKYISIMKKAWGYERHTFFVEPTYIQDDEYLEYIEERYHV